MKRNLITVKVGDEVANHFPDISGNYATLCGMDGDDPTHEVGQETIPTPKNAKVNCRLCSSIYLLCREYPKSILEDSK